MAPTETPSAYKLRIELLNERLPTKVAYAPALLAHVAYKCLDPNRYGDFQKNVRAGNKSVETITGLFTDIESFDNLAVEQPSNASTSILKTPSARTVSFSKTPDQEQPSDNPAATFDWKGQKDLSVRQAAFLLKKFQHKGCILCRTNEHELVCCPALKDKMVITIKRNKTNRPSPTGSARTATADDADLDEDTTTTTDTTAEEQGKSPPILTSTISTPTPEEVSLLPFATSEQNLTIVSVSTQDEYDSDDNDQLGSFRQEIFPGQPDPSITNAMRNRRDMSNASKIAIAHTAYTTFVGPHGPCMGRASKVSLDRVIKSGYACVDSGATHDMSNGTADEFADYKLLPKGSHVLVADNHPIECLGIGTQFMRIQGRITGKRQVLHVPALKAPLISVRQHRRHQGCSFIADNKGCYMTFPTFSIEVDDSTDCLVAYEIINPSGFDISKCDYMQGEPDKIENLAITETRRSENERKSRSQQHQNQTPIVKWGRGMQRRIKTPLEAEQGYAWRVETRASVRRQQEQIAQLATMEEQTNQARNELS
jgi:hypothetical protein